MSDKPTCTCRDTACPNHPTNHSEGCDRCIEAERVQLILEGTGRSKEDAKAMAQVLMKLLVTCMFDMELDLVEVLETAGKLPSPARQQK